MASIQAGRLKVELSPQRVEDLVREAIEFQLPLASEHGIELTAEMNVGGAQVDGDRERILEVFSNLLGNALKFGRRGDRITVRARQVGGEVRLSVADQGPGIPAAEQEHIFEAYWSVERNGKKGIGLGLFITKGIIEAHHGRIWVESETGMGSEFVFTLPIARG
jgi:signal transduction histidine kinase